jgi:hypothetical protein
MQHFRLLQQVHPHSEPPHNCLHRNTSGNGKLLTRGRHEHAKGVMMKMGLGLSCSWCQQPSIRVTSTGALAIEVSVINTIKYDSSGKQQQQQQLWCILRC